METKKFIAIVAGLFLLIGILLVYTTDVDLTDETNGTKELNTPCVYYEPTIDKMSWVQDVDKEEALSLCEKMQTRNARKSPPGSIYVLGESKSGESGKVGIYFHDPTATAH